MEKSVLHKAAEKRIVSIYPIFDSLNARKLDNFKDFSHF